MTRGEQQGHEAVLTADTALMVPTGQAQRGTEKPQDCSLSHRAARAVAGVMGPEAKLTCFNWIPPAQEGAMNPAAAWGVGETMAALDSEE